MSKTESLPNFRCSESHKIIGVFLLFKNTKQAQEQWITTSTKQKLNHKVHIRIKENEDSIATTEQISTSQQEGDQ